MKIQLKRSSILENGVAKEPTAGQMEYGELAVNYNENDISIFTKDSDNNIRRVGGSINKGSGEPGDPGTTPGDWYFDITNGILFYWNGTEWEEVQSVNKLIAGNGIEITTATTGSTFTVDLAGGDDGLEFDGGKLKATLASESDYGVVKIGDGVVADNGVIKAKNTISVGENPPAINLKQGDLWWNSNEDNGRLYVYYEDENTQQWIDASPQGGNLEQDQADTLYLSKKNDDTAAGNITFDKNIYVKQSAGIGGTAADPKIQLNADGSAELTNDLILRRSSSVYALLDANSSVDLDITVNAGRANTEGRVKFRGSRGGGNLATRSLITAAGDIYIGGTLDTTAGSEAPNIQLKSDGSAEFSNNQTIQFRPTLADGTSAYALRLLDSTDAAVWQVNADGDSFQVGSHSINGNITLNASDGSATFNSTGQFGGSWSNDDSPQVRAFVGSNVGSVRVKGSASGGANSNAFGVYAGGSSASSQTYGVYYDGHVEIGGLIGSAPNISLNADGSLSAEKGCIRTLVNSTLARLIIDSKNANAGADIAFYDNGAISGLIGYDTDADGISINCFNANGLTFKTSNSYRAKIESDGTFKIGGTLPSAPNISLNADGSVASGPISTQNNTSAVNYLWQEDNNCRGRSATLQI